MPMLTLRPVRLPDATLAMGAEYLCGNRQALAARLCSLVSAMEAWGWEDGRLSAPGLQLSLAHSGKELLCGMNLLVKALGQSVQEAELAGELDLLKGLLMPIAADCALSPAEQAGAVRCFPSDPNCWYYLRREYISAFDPEDVPADGTGYFFNTLGGDCRLDAEGLLAKLPADSGVVLNLFPDSRSEAERRLIAGARAQCAGREGAFSDYYWGIEDGQILSYTCSVYAARVEDAQSIHHALSAMAVDGILCACGGGDLALMYENAVNPWALQARYARACGDETLGRLMWSLTHKELDRLTGASGDMIGAEGPEEDAGATLSRVEAALGTAVAAGAEAHSLSARLAEVSARLDELARQQQNTAELFGQVREIRQSVRQQGQAVAEQLQAQDQRLGQAIGKAEARLIGYVDKRMDGYVERLNEVLRREQKPEDACRSLRREMPDLDAGLSREDLTLLGVEREEQLAQMGVSPSLMESLRYAMALFHLGERADPEKISNYIPFSFAMGYLYEALATEYFKANLYAHEPQQEAPFQLSWLDNLRCDRVVSYANHALLKEREGEYARMPVGSWIIWFNIMRNLRLLRNKVHGDRGPMSREEMGRMFRGLFEPTNRAKEMLLSTEDGRLMLFVKGSPLESVPQGWPRWSDLVQAVREDPAFSESSLRFLLRCRDARWEI